MKSGRRQSRNLVRIHDGPLSHEQCELFTRRIEIMLRRGNWHAVHAIADEAERLGTPTAPYVDPVELE